MINEALLDKANSYKRELLHKRMHPISRVEFFEDNCAFQGISVRKLGNVSLPIRLGGSDSIILDFADHAVGYLNFSIMHMLGRIVDSPIMLKFSFGEFPLELTTPTEAYKGRLGKGWLQTETRAVVFTPYSGRLERRYSFRYLRIERVDNTPVDINIEDIFVDAVSAVDMASVPRPKIEDPELAKIYEMSLKTLKECEQDVFEDGPKRDRRLWIGDLRLQALTDYRTFKNYDLIRRCIYLFAACRTSDGLVSPCVFPDSPPFTGDWVFLDYSLYFISCLYDLALNGGNLAEIKLLYPIAKYQADYIEGLFDEKGSVHYKESHEGYYFIDWCDGLDKEVAFISVFVYVMRQLSALEELLGEDNCTTLTYIEKYEDILRSFYDGERKLFVTSKGQISWHTQIWVVLSGILSDEDGADLLRRIEKINPKYTMRTPYMMHYYIEALVSVGMKDKALEFIREHWGRMASYGYDCCPEVYNPENELESPYGAPEINSACHAWSCTPAYWFYKLFDL